MQKKELGSYILLEQIAVGGMAEIYMAKTRGVAGFEKFLCLKVIHPNYADDDQFIEMLIDEAKIAVGLNHVNIAQIFDLGHDDKTYFIAMEFIDGADLFKIMRSLSERDIEVPIDTAVFIAQEICTGLDYAHRKRDESGKPQGIIHRDISPQNVLVSNAGEVKIIDFGIAKAASRTRKTQAGVIKGKYYYMSPEQAWGDPVDARTDIFSAGIILYEVLTGQMLYLEEDMNKLLDMVRKADIPRPSTRRSGIPPELENSVMKALAKRPADRWQTAHEFQVALTSFLYSYSPDFTPERLAEMLNTAISEDELGKSRPDEQQFAGGQDDDSEQLMSRVDFRPEIGNSVIFNVDDYLPPRSTGDDEVDLGDDEATMITAPPEMLERLGILPPKPTPSGGLELELDSGELDLGDYDENAPTKITTNPGLRPRDLDLLPGESPFSPPSLKKAATPPAREVVIPGSLKPPSLGDRSDPELGRAPVIQHHPSAEVERPDLTGPLPKIPKEEAPTGRLEPAGARATQSAVWTSAPKKGDALQPESSGAAWNWPPQAAQTPPQAGQQAAAPAGQAWPPQGEQAPASNAAPQNQAQETDQWASTSNLQGLQALQAAWPGGKVGQSTISADSLSPDLDLAEEAYYRQNPRRRLRVILTVMLITLMLSGLAAGAYFLVTYSGEASGTAEIISKPAGAQITLDGRPLNKKTPATLPVMDLKSHHVVELKLDHYKDWREEFEFPAGNLRIKVVATLEPITGKVTVRSDPSGAALSIGGSSRGKTPITVGGLDTTEDLELQVRKPGYATITRTVQWKERNVLEVSFSLEKAR